MTDYRVKHLGYNMCVKVLCFIGLMFFNFSVINGQDCTTDPCKNGATCTDGEASYTCQCVTGYTGGDCDIETSQSSFGKCECYKDAGKHFYLPDIDDCVGNPCINGATCTDGVDSYTCMCVAGYTDGNCETDIDECSSDPCLNGGTCSNEVNSYTCICVAGYTGDICQTDVDECTLSPCSNGGTCTNSDGSYSCACVDGYTGADCQEDVDECTLSPCSNGGTCTNNDGSYSCACVNGYTGADCQEDVDECTLSPCSNGGTCTNNDGSYSCACVDGYTGADCQEDVDECTLSPCSNGGTCTNNDGSYSCACVDGYTGADCQEDVDECMLSPCSNGGTCTNNDGSYSCTCVDGYTGADCQQDVDECTLSPCSNGGTCTNNDGSYSCACVNGYTGADCQEDVDECTLSPCSNGGTCTNNDGSYSCACVDGYTGADCQEDVDECTLSPCSNGGTCTNNDGSYSCACVDGYTGADCQEDVDECMLSPCSNRGTCTNNDGSYSCTCVDGYTGADCQQDVDECMLSPCSNGGTCTNNDGSYSCACVDGYTGADCQQDIDECLSAPCMYGGTCNDGVNSYTCICVPGYVGTTCETDQNECESNPCENGGMCDDNVNSFKCQCLDGYTDVTCQTDIDECASSPCGNNGDCTDDVNWFSCTCNPGYTDVTCRPSVIGDSCSLNVDVCTGLENAECNGTSCVCLPGYVLSGTSCVIDYATAYNGYCVISEQCVTNSSTCRTDGNDVNRCLCPMNGTSQYMSSHDTCVEESSVSIDQACISVVQCTTTNSLCAELSAGQTTCTCASDSFPHYDSSADSCLADCGTLTNPTNGLVALPDVTMEGQVAIYSCNVGYATSGNGVRTCLSTGAWSGDAPICVPGCPALSSPSNGYVNDSSRVVGARASYSCMEGYILVGDTERTCLVDSQWDGSTPECLKECPALSPITDGNVDQSAGTWDTSVATYICNDGYTLVGNAVRRCQTTGHWSGLEPSCSDILFPTQLNLILGALLIVTVLTLIFIAGLFIYNKCKTPSVKEQQPEPEDDIPFGSSTPAVIPVGMVPPTDTRKPWIQKHVQVTPEFVDESGSLHPPPSKVAVFNQSFDRNRLRFMNGFKRPVKVEMAQNIKKLNCKDPEDARESMSTTGQPFQEADKGPPVDGSMQNDNYNDDIENVDEMKLEEQTTRTSSPHPIGNDNQVDRFRSYHRQMHSFKNALKTYR